MHHHHIVHAFPSLLGWQHHRKILKGVNNVGKTYGSPNQVIGEPIFKL